MRPVFLAGAVVASLVCSSGLALAQKSGGILKMYHRDNPPTLSIHESSTNSTVIPMMPLFNNLVVYDQKVAQNSAQSIVPDLDKSWAWSADGKAAITSFSIVTTDAAPSTAKVHDRMPVILEESQFDGWMCGATEIAAEMMRPYAGAIEQWEVGPDVGNVRNNRPELLDRVGLL